MIDLHVHTTESDGTTTPSKLVDLAVEKGLKAIAITDHDTSAGYAEAVEAAKGKNIEIIPGVEFGTKYQSSVHLLGYYVDTKNAELIKLEEGIVQDRDNRNRGIVELLQKDGIDITYEQMKEKYGEIVGRPHFAQVLVENSIVNSVTEAFALYLGRGMKYWLPRKTVPIETCIQVVLAADGIPILAHPLEYKVDTNTLIDTVDYCFDLGVMGIEVLHPSHPASQCLSLNRIADRYHILKTGGSDYHGLDIKPNNQLGMMNVPDEWLDRLKQAKFNK